MLKLKLLNKDEAIDYIEQPDLYLESLTPYYIKQILGNSDKYSDFITNFQNSCGDFNNKAHSTIEEYEDRINKRLEYIKLDINETVYFILTNGKDNISLPYTKGKAVIVPYLKNTISQNFSSNLLDFSLTAHEIFHTLSRNNQQLRKDCYQSLGWKDAGKCLIPQNILDEIFINPDAVSHDHYLEYVDFDNIISYIAPIMYKSMSANHFVIFDSQLNYKEIKPFNAFPKYNSMWKNTGYNNHPEELSAEHFCRLITTNKYNDKEMMKSFYQALLKNFAIDKNVLQY